MKYLKNVTSYANILPKAVWVVALVVPGGFTAIGVWLVAKSAYRVIKKRKNDKN